MGSMAAGAGTSRIPRVIGEARAMELLLDGRPISMRPLQPGMSTARRAAEAGLRRRIARPPLAGQAHRATSRIGRRRA